MPLNNFIISISKKQKMFEVIPHSEEHIELDYISLARANTLKELQMVEAQSDLLRMIADRISVSRYKNQSTDNSIENSDPNELEISFMPALKNHERIETTTLSLLLNETVSKKIVNLDQALAEVKYNCTDQVYQIILRAIEKGKARSQAYYQKLVEKEKNRYFELFNKYHIISKQNETLREKLDNHQENLEKAQKSEKLLRKNSTNEKISIDAVRIKVEEKMLHQQILLQEKRVKLQRQEAITMKEKQALVELQKTVFQALQKVGSCEKAEVFQKCRDSLVKQKECLKQDEKLVQQYYQKLENMYKAFTIKFGAN